MPEKSGGSTIKVPTLQARTLPRAGFHWRPQKKSGRTPVKKNAKSHPVQIPGRDNRKYPQRSSPAQRTK